ncbi:replication protein A 70 kDa DNA-binding subunit-like isoform X2 [Vanessa cardui]|uniref:replication protein A 70 kDa DNA-binding subunit-like isoform X2 n=1 Tax=Vanessa cardui TaxID=171605 RepID=UPI001F13A2C1|nr:replication protein A 70 kDa DNA-binding subunit-like isoform X2 [Vanessa cardui]
MPYTLSNGSLEIIMKGGVYENPVIQVLGFLKLEEYSINEKYRLQISDGKYYHGYAILATQLNHKLYSGELSLFSVVQINKFETVVLHNNENDRKIIIILDINIIARGKEVGRKLGNPQLWIGASASAAPAQTPTLKASPASTSRTPTPLAGTSFNTSAIDSKFTIPIASLTPYKSKWCIKARVVKKDEVKTYGKLNNGKYFKLVLCDDGGEIAATAFNDDCDKFYSKIEVDRVYYISSCKIKLANKQFNKLNNDYELVFQTDTVIAECCDNVSTLPTVKYDFLSISDIANKSPDAIIDVIGVCKIASDLQERTTKSTGKILKKREMTLVDQSHSAITVQLWGNDAEKFVITTNTIIALKGALLIEFNGCKSLSCLSTTILQSNPDLPDAHRLRGWYDHGGASADLVNISTGGGGSAGGRTEWITLKEAQTRRTRCADKSEYYNLLGVIIYTLSDNVVYKACPQENCNKKLENIENGMFLCKKCGKEYPNFKYRLLLGGTISDPTGDHKITAFNEVAESLLGKSANEVSYLLQNDNEGYGRLFDEINFKTFLFNLRDNYDNQTRLQTVVMSAQPLNYKDANSRLIKSIRALSEIQV